MIGFQAVLKDQPRPRQAAPAYGRGFPSPQLPAQSGAYMNPGPNPYANIGYQQNDLLSALSLLAGGGSNHLQTQTKLAMRGIGAEVTRAPLAAAPKRTFARKSAPTPKRKIHQKRLKAKPQPIKIATSGWLTF